MPHEEPREEPDGGDFKMPAVERKERLFAGTSGWAFPAWKPAFFPEKLPAKKFLPYYASRLNAVEVNYSFRHFIGERTARNWVQDTPPAFAFCVKAHQAITHVRRLKDVEEPLRRFLDSLQPLAEAGRLGPALFQLPPNLAADVKLLDQFLAQLPTELPAGGFGFRAAFEFRHKSWFQAPVFDVLRRHGAALCLAESDELIVPHVITADFLYYRFRRSSYSPEDRRDIAVRLRREANEGRPVYAFFKHEESPESALWAEEIRRAA